MSTIICPHPKKYLYWVTPTRMDCKLCGQMVYVEGFTLS